MTDLEKIKAATTGNLPKVKALNKEQIANILYSIYFTIGIARDRWPVEAESKRIVAYVRENMADLTSVELTLAFEFWCKRKLDFTGEHYNTFSINFLEQVISAYKRYRAGCKSNQSKPYEEDNYKPTDEEMLQSRLKDFELAFNNFLNDKPFWDFGSVKYNFLKKHGCLEIEPKDDELAEKLAEEMWVREINKKDQNRGLSLGRSLLPSRTKVQALEEYKQLVILSWYFKAVKDQNRSITEEILNLK